MYIPSRKTINIATSESPGIVMPDGTTISVDNDGTIHGSSGGVATSVIGTEETGSTASKSYSAGEYFVKDDKLCKVTTSISSGATLTKNTNYTEGDVSSELNSSSGIERIAYYEVETSDMTYCTLLNNVYAIINTQENIDKLNNCKLGFVKFKDIITAPLFYVKYEYSRFYFASPIRDYSSVSYLFMYFYNSDSMISLQRCGDGAITTNYSPSKVSQGNTISVYVLN